MIHHLLLIRKIFVLIKFIIYNHNSHLEKLIFFVRIMEEEEKILKKYNVIILKIIKIIRKFKILYLHKNSKIQ